MAAFTATSTPLLRGSVVLLVLTVLAAADVFVRATAQEAAMETGTTQPSFLKSWGDWAQRKMSPYYYGSNKAAGKTPLNQNQPASHMSDGSSSSWSDWAYQKLASFSGRASDNAKEATEAGKKKIETQGAAANKHGEEMWEGAKEGVKERGAKATEYAKNVGGDKAKTYAEKAKEGVQHQAERAYEAGKDLGSQAAHKLREDAEL